MAPSENRTHISLDPVKIQYFSLLSNLRKIPWWQEFSAVDLHGELYGLHSSNKYQGWQLSVLPTFVKREKWVTVVGLKKEFPVAQPFLSLTFCVAWESEATRENPMSDSSTQKGREKLREAFPFLRASVLRLSTGRKQSTHLQYGASVRVFMRVLPPIPALRLGLVESEKVAQQQEQKQKRDPVADMRLGILCTQGSRMAFSAPAGELIIDRTAKWVHASRGQLTSVGLPERKTITIWKVLPSISDSQEKG